LLRLRTVTPSSLWRQSQVFSAPIVDSYPSLSRGGEGVGQQDPEKVMVKMREMPINDFMTKNGQAAHRPVIRTCTVLK